MIAFSMNKAQMHFDQMMLQAQREVVQITKHGNVVAVVMSAEQYNYNEQIKRQLLQFRALNAKADIAAGNFIDGETFFSEIETGKYDRSPD